MRENVSYSRSCSKRPGAKVCGLPARAARSMLIVLFFVLSSPCVALSQGDQKGLSAADHQQLSAAQALLQGEKWDEADRLLEKVTGQPTATPLARALAWQMRGFLYHSTNKVDKAYQAYEQALALDVLDQEARSQLLSNTAQLLSLLGRHKEAAGRVNQWLGQAGTLTADDRVRAASVLFESGRYADAATQLKTAIKSTADSKDEWSEMLLAALHHGRQFAELTQWLPQRIAKQPGDKRLWQHLALAHQQLKEDRQAAAVLLAGYESRVFDRPEEIVVVVQALRRADSPLLGARVLEEALRTGRLAADLGHLDLLAETWLQAREMRQAASALTRRAELGDSCARRLRIGRLYLHVEDWPAAHDHLERAAQGGCVHTRPESLLLLGQIHYQAGQLQKARQAFLLARDIPPSRQRAESWLKVLEERG